MKLFARINDRDLELELEREGEKVVAVIEGRRYELELSFPEEGVFLIKDGGKVHEMLVTPGRTPGDPVTVRSQNGETAVSIFDPRKLRGSQAMSGSDSGAAEIRTQMPGKVVRVISAIGDQVEAGEAVIVVEAMKMQNEMKSPKDGTVREMRFTEGETVNAGDVLVVID